MKNRLRKLLLLATVVGIAFAFTACSSDSSSDSADSKYNQLTLTCAALDKENTAKAHEMSIFMDLVEEKSGGAITFRKFWSAQLGTATDNLNTIGYGIADVGTVCTLYTPSSLTLSQIAYCVPFQSSDVKVTSEQMYKIAEKYPEFYKEYENNNVKCLAWKGNEPYKLYSTKGYKTLKDLKGKNITLGGVYYVPWFKSIGAVPVTAAAADLYQTINNNLASGSFVYDSIYCDYKLYEVEANVTEIDLGARNCDVIAMNQDTWNSLNEDTQKLIQECADEAMDQFHDWEEEQMASWEQEMKDNGVKFLKMSEADKEEWANTALEYEDTLQSWIKDANAAGYDGEAIMSDYLKIGEELGIEWKFDASKYIKD